MKLLKTRTQTSPPDWTGIGCSRATARRDSPRLRYWNISLVCRKPFRISLSFRAIANTQVCRDLKQKPDRYNSLIERICSPNVKIPQHSSINTAYGFGLALCSSPAFKMLSRPLSATWTIIESITVNSSHIGVIHPAET